MVGSKHVQEEESGGGVVEHASMATNNNSLKREEEQLAMVLAFLRSRNLRQTELTLLKEYCWGNQSTDLLVQGTATNLSGTNGDLEDEGLNLSEVLNSGAKSGTHKEIHEDDVENVIVLSDDGEDRNDDDNSPRTQPLDEDQYTLLKSDEEEEEEAEGLSREAFAANSRDEQNNGEENFEEEHIEVDEHGTRSKPLFVKQRIQHQIDSYNDDTHDNLADKGQLKLGGAEQQFNEVAQSESKRQLSAPFEVEGDFTLSKQLRQLDDITQQELKERIQSSSSSLPTQHFGGYNDNDSYGFGFDDDLSDEWSDDDDPGYRRTLAVDEDILEMLAYGKQMTDLQDGSVEEDEGEADDLDEEKDEEEDDMQFNDGKDQDEHADSDDDGDDEYATADEAEKQVISDKKKLRKQLLTGDEDEDEADQVAESLFTQEEDNDEDDEDEDDDASKELADDEYSHGEAASVRSASEREQHLTNEFELQRQQQTSANSKLEQKEQREEEEEDQDKEGEANDVEPAGHDDYSEPRIGVPLPDSPYETFDLKVIYQKNRTGFEDVKDFPIRINTVIAGRYQILEYLGSAAFSSAVQCLDLKTGQLVCIKIIKNNKDFFDQSLDEIKLLMYINAHGDPDENHVLQLYDYFYYKEHLFLVCELLRDNLYEYSKYNREHEEERYFTIPRLQKIARQILRALSFVHGLNLIHCDLKPENILIKSYSRCEIKVIDFGSSCFTTDHLSLYVQSRSYRAPEVILGLPYNQKIDMWSVGCILAELFTGKELFQNDSIQTMLARMISVLGMPDRDYIIQGRFSSQYFTKNLVLFEQDKETGAVYYLHPKKTSLRKRLAGADEYFIDFVSKLLDYRPENRPTAQEALKHPWFQVQYD